MQLPTLVGAWGTFDYDPKLGTCSIMEDAHGHSSKTTLFIIAFVIPCIIIIACYTKSLVVHKSEQRLKRHANKQNSIPNNLRTTPNATGSNVETGIGQAGFHQPSSSFSTDVKQVGTKQTTHQGTRELRAKRNEWRITKMVLAIF
ncbi:G-protein coupled receptor moody [Eumeta japonica]|uniref:G-protein coupled receptor moody n=1 Tax=Eumeta variegata TaxID=151549 RepID=A0A4C1SRW0_EUMVA|nr:G-protein coupled receptor moody [Eumeta japonica]